MYSVSGHRPLSRVEGPGVRVDTGMNVKRMLEKELCVWGCARVVLCCVVLCVSVRVLCVCVCVCVCD